MILVILQPEFYHGAPHVDVLEGLLDQFTEFVSEEEPSCCLAQERVDGKHCGVGSNVSFQCLWSMVYSSLIEQCIQGSSLSFQSIVFMGTCPMIQMGGVGCWKNPSNI